MAFIDAHPPLDGVSDATTTSLAERIYAENYGVDGVRKVHAGLLRQGHPVARCTVARLVCPAGLGGK